MEKKIIAIGSDHAGFFLKEEIKKLLSEYEIIDFGCMNEEPADYPDIALKVCNEVLGKNINGILVCGTGIGMSIAANRIKGIRAALCHDEYTAEMSRKHNNANILCLGGRILDLGTAKKIVKIWLESDFEGGRHENRLEKIEKMLRPTKNNH